MSGKGDTLRPVDMDKAVIYCVHSRFKDKCEKCKEDSESCLYCKKINGVHEKKCYTIKKKVKIRMIVEYEIDVPITWNSDDIEFHRNDGSWCADNAIDELIKISESGNCLCPKTKFEYIEDCAKADKGKNKGVLDE